MVGWMASLCTEVYVPVCYYTIDMLPRKAPHSLIKAFGLGMKKIALVFSRALRSAMCNGREKEVTTRQLN